MDNKLYGQLLIMKDNIDDDSQASDVKMKTYDSKLDKLKAIIKNIMEQIKNSNYSPEKLYSPKAQYINIVVPAKKKSTPMEGGNSTNIGCMWILKHESSSSKFYELIIKT